jgi:hypothetical protein
LLLLVLLLLLLLLVLLLLSWTIASRETSSVIASTVL